MKRCASVYLSALTWALALLSAVSAYAGFNPPSSVPYNAAAYGDRAKLRNATGLIGLGAYGGPINANLFSQDITYAVPVLSLPGRAGLNLVLGLTYNSKVWIKSGTTIYFNGDQGWPAVGWQLGFGRIDGVYAGTDGYNHYYLISPDGSVHDLKYNSADGLYESTDSTYIDFNDSTGVLRLKDGTQITFALIGGTGGFVLPTQIKDRNGNYITINYTGSGQNISSMVDTVARTVTFTYNPDGTLASISNPGFGGGARTWSFAYTNVTLSYNFGTLTVNGPSSGSSVKVLSSITYPNGTQASFLYNSYAQMTETDFLSNSSTVRGKYLATWQATPSGGWTDSPTPSQVGNFDGTNTNNWSLSFGNYTTTVTDPTNVAQTTTFLQTGGWDDGLPSQTQIGSPALRTIATVWGNDGNLINQRPTSITTTLNDTNQQSQVQYLYTSYGNVSEVQEYDYGLVLVRKTDTTYITDPNYTSRHILNLPSMVIVSDGSGSPKSNTAFTYDNGALTSATGATNHDDSNYGTGFTYRGLVTTVTQYANPVGPSGPIAHNRSYDMLGNLRTQATDCCIQRQYNFSSTTQFSQPDSIVRGSGTTTLTTSATYDSNTGLLASATDPNSQTTSYSYDVMNRMTSLTRPDTTVLSTSYDDTSANPGITATTPITSSTKRVKTLSFDGMGRPVRVTTQDGSGTVYSKADRQYDSLGRVSQVSNPYTGASASYWTQLQYDTLSRVLKVIPSDGTSTSNNVAYAYSGNAVTATDQAGKQHSYKRDALGRVIEVDEPDPNNGNSLTLVTTYAHDPLNHLTHVTQGNQTRTYGFDGIGRKTSETTPEAGSVSYTYDNYSHVLTRTDARNVVKTYTYDGLERVKQVSYNTTGTPAAATPTVSYTYGTSAASYNNGRLVTMADGPGSETYTYDQLGRRTQVQKVIANVTFTTSYAYNLAHEVTSMTHPSGRVVTRSFDAIGRLQGLKNSATNANYVSNASYDAASHLSGFTYGNNVAASYTFTPQRLQLSTLSYSAGSQSLISLTYGYSQNGGNNGQITSIADGVDAGRTANYGYDSLKRLTSAQTNGSTNYAKWGLSWTYDRYSNRTAQNVTAGSGPSNSVTVNATTNQVTSMGGVSFVYDASGNLVQDDLYKYVYDAENNLVQVQTLSGGQVANYTVDGHKRRVVKVVGTSRTFQIYAGRKLISEFSDAASNTYNPGTTPQQAPADTVSLLLYHHPDHLTARMTTDNFGNVANNHAHYPFGESWYDTGAASTSVTRKFASYVKDTETGAGQLHYALFREHSARIGRFQMADPVQSGGGSPQGLNRYAYVRNDPINTTDPSGRFGIIDEFCDCDGGGEVDLSALFGGDIVDSAGSLATDANSNDSVSNEDPSTPDPQQPDQSNAPPDIRPDPSSFPDLTNLVGPPSEPAPPPGYEDCVAAALLEVIAHGEGTNNQPNGGYGTLVFGTVVSAPGDFSGLVGERGTRTAPITIENPEALSGHPGIRVQVNSSTYSTAFGRYQIKAGTAAEFGITDFSPAGQDAAAIAIMQSRNMIAPAMNGDFQQAMLNGNRRWASLPGSPYGQPTMTMEQAYGAFQNAVNTLPECQ